MPFKFTPDIEAITTTVAARVVEVTAQTTAALRGAILRMFREGIDPVTGARMLRAMVGMTQAQTLQAMSFRQGLINRGFNAATSTRLFDKFVATKILLWTTTMVRMETMTVLNGGQQLGWNQGVARGVIDKNVMVKKWLVSPTSLEPCVICEGQRDAVVEIDQDFAISLPAHAQCRCSAGLVRRSGTRLAKATPSTINTKIFQKYASTQGNVIRQAMFEVLGGGPVTTKAARDARLVLNALRKMASYEGPLLRGMSVSSSELSGWRVGSTLEMKIPSS